MSLSEKVSILGDFRKVLQDFLAPELREVTVQLRALSDGQREMETRLLREIKNSEEKILLTIKLSEATQKLESTARINEEVMRENQALKREKTQ